MGENVAVNVDFWGRMLTGSQTTTTSSTSVLCIPNDVTWPDFSLLIKLTFQCEAVIIQYFDEENDAVMINSQEELAEAMKLAKKYGNTLHIRVTESYPEPADGMKFETDCVMAAPETKMETKESATTAINFSAAQNETEETGEVMHTDEACNSPSAKKEAILVEKDVKGYYAKLACDVGNTRGEIVKACGTRMQCASQYDLESGEQSPMCDVTAPPPPVWFQQYMDRFKEDVSNEISDQVARKTVRQILRGLDGAVIHSVKGTSGKPAVLQESSTDGEAIYCHSGIICDCCEQTIVGNRYKCGNCEDYDLCEQCESIEGIHEPDHVFIKIKRPALTAGRKKGRMFPLLRKSLYSPAEEVDEKIKEAKMLERMQEREARLAERGKRREEKQEEKLKRKEEKLKRRHEHQRDVPHKKERLDLPKYRLKDRCDAFFIKDETITDGTKMPPGTKFTKKWLMRNTGNMAWDEGTKLCFLWGNLPPKSPQNGVPHLQPQEEGVLVIELVAPEEPGMYQNHWRLQHRNYSFGHRVWCSIVVEKRKVLEPVSATAPALEIVSCEDRGDTNSNTIETQGHGDKARNEEQGGTADSASSIADQIVTNAESGETTICNPERQLLSPCKELLSFELLEITEEKGKKIPRVSQTATPNNTPLDMTPPKSPVAEIDLAAACHLSNSSSVELVTESPLVENDFDRMSALVQERMAALGLKPGQGEFEVDIESISSGAEESDETESDFFIVPLPECFNTSIPLNRSLMSPGATCGSATNTVSDCSSEKSVDDMLTTSNTIPLTPLTPSVALRPLVKSEQDVSDDSSDDETGMDRETGTIIDGMKGIELHGDTGSVADAVAKIELSDDNLEAAALETPVLESGVKTEVVENDETGETVAKEQKVNDEVVDREEDGEDDIYVVAEGTGASADERRGRNNSGASFVQAAIGIASVAATQAYHTAKDVFQTLQARNQYVPPESDWKPPQDNWTPPESGWTPPKSEWTPPQGRWTPLQPEPKPREVSPMDQLIEMGFADRDVNQRLLEKHDSDIEKVVSELLQSGDNDWHLNRH